MFMILNNAHYGVCVRAMGLENEGGGARCNSRSGSGGTLGFIYIERF